MKDNNQKEIDMIVGEIISCENDIEYLREYSMFDGKHLKEKKRREDCAISILAKLEGGK